VTIPKLELWCDSFHEGVWAAEGLLAQLPLTAIARSFHLGFIPQYDVQVDGQQLHIDVFGGYNNWLHLPPKIRELLDWGKPDVIGFDPKTETILFAVEETAAVPTGNQALQRCERMYGAANMRVPFWYLLSQFGIHADEGTRQASPWPALMAMALTPTFRVPNVVLLYSSEDAPEDYTKGAGVAQLFKSLAHMTQNFMKGNPLLEGVAGELDGQFSSMLHFIADTYENVTDFLPNAQLLSQADTAARLASIATGADAGKSTFPLLDWPISKNLPAKVSEAQAAYGCIKHDPFLSLLENGRAAQKVYTLSSNAGSRPQPENKLATWIAQQNVLHSKATALSPVAPFTLKLSDFPESHTGLRHVTTAKNILYLVDDETFVYDSLVAAFPRLANKLPNGKSRPALVYVSNSVKPGRIFGDPYTGQFAAFSWIFGGTEAKPRVRVAYFPHHSHGVLNPTRTTPNKGQLLFLNRADYLVFHSGAVYSVENAKWL
jgi:hypothetical protein